MIRNLYEVIMKKLLALILVLILVAGCISMSGCKGYTDPTENITVTASQDKYRNFYEIFVGSFCDSNDDGVGDLQGIISKLDYLNDGNPETDEDLGIDGIWLTPVMPSHSYHKYDVIDYFAIDEQFGTLEDFRQLIDECHKRGINVIIDMVLNHCSKFMPLFENACKEALEGNLDGDARYFEIDYYDSAPSNAYKGIGLYDNKVVCYEGNFSDYMPEWDLNSKDTRKYFLEIADFWLNDYDVDGFRLDALTYYSSPDTDGKEFMKWYYDEVQKIKPDVYMVGEYWTGNSDITQMYGTQIDSLFEFGFASSTGAFMNSVRNQENDGLITQVKTYVDGTDKVSDKVINAYFLSNHDQVRSGNYLKSYGVNYTKMAASAYMLMPGNPFIYYGEEIGMMQDSQQNADEYKREPMVWDTENPPTINVNNVTSYDESQAPYGGVEQQLKDENSVLSHYKRIIKIRNQNPEIARGKITGEYEFDDKSLCGYYVEYNDSTIMIIHNFSAEEEKEVEITDDVMKSFEFRGDLVASKGVEGRSSKNVILNGKKFTMPPQSTIILKGSK